MIKVLSRVNTNARQNIINPEKIELLAKTEKSVVDKKTKIVTLVSTELPKTKARTLAGIAQLKF